MDPPPLEERMALMPSDRQMARFQQQTGKNPDEMTNDELDEAINKGGNRSSGRRAGFYG